MDETLRDCINWKQECIESNECIDAWLENLEKKGLIVEDAEPGFECLFDMVECKHMYDLDNMSEHEFKGKYCLYCLLNDVREAVENINHFITPDIDETDAKHEYYTDFCDEIIEYDLEGMGVLRGLSVILLMKDTKSVRKTDEGYEFEIREKVLKVAFDEMLKPDFFALQYFKEFEEFLEDFDNKTWHKYVECAIEDNKNE